MEPIRIADGLKGQFPDDVLAISEYRGQVSVSVKRDNIVDVCRWLHNEPELRFDLLMDLCGVDWLGKRSERFEVVYNLYSMQQRHMLRLKVPLLEEDPNIKSVISVWRGAGWHERECYDMFGITFDDHPDLRRILMPEDWEGWPLRKDYPLKGPTSEEDWAEYREVVRMKDRLKEFEWKSR